VVCALGFVLTKACLIKTCFHAVEESDQESTPPLKMSRAGLFHCIIYRPDVGHNRPYAVGAKVLICVEGGSLLANAIRSSVVAIECLHFTLSGTLSNNVGSCGSGTNTIGATCF
jgi:hypothetical protein